MSKNTQLTNLVVNAQADALAALLNGGKIKIYDGRQPGNADVQLSANNLLCTLNLAAPAFALTAAGVMTANPIPEASITANGVAAWFRAYKADGITAVMDGTIGLVDENIIVSSTTFSVGVMVTCSAFTHTIAKYASGL